MSWQNYSYLNSNNSNVNVHYEYNDNMHNVLPTTYIQPANPVNDSYFATESYVNVNMIPSQYRVAETQTILQPTYHEFYEHHAPQVDGSYDHNTNETEHTHQSTQQYHYQQQTEQTYEQSVPSTSNRPPPKKRGRPSNSNSETTKKLRSVRKKKTINEDEEASNYLTTEIDMKGFSPEPNDNFLHLFESGKNVSPQISLVSIVPANLPSPTKEYVSAVTSKPSSRAERLFDSVATTTFSNEHINTSLTSKSLSLDYDTNSRSLLQSINPLKSFVDQFNCDTDKESDVETVIEDAVIELETIKTKVSNKKKPKKKSKPQKKRSKKKKQVETDSENEATEEDEDYEDNLPLSHFHENDSYYSKGVSSEFQDIKLPVVAIANSLGLVNDCKVLMDKIDYNEVIRNKPCPASKKKLNNILIEEDNEENLFVDNKEELGYIPRPTRSRSKPCPASKKVVEEVTKPFHQTRRSTPSNNSSFSLISKPVPLVNSFTNDYLPSRRQRSNTNKEDILSLSEIKTRKINPPTKPKSKPCPASKKKPQEMEKVNYFTRRSSVRSDEIIEIETIPIQKQSQKKEPIVKRNVIKDSEIDIACLINPHLRKRKVKFYDNEEYPNYSFDGRYRTFFNGHYIRLDADLNTDYLQQIGKENLCLTSLNIQQLYHYFKETNRDLEEEINYIEKMREKEKEIAKSKKVSNEIKNLKSNLNMRVKTKGELKQLPATNLSLSKLNSGISLRSRNTNSSFSSKLKKSLKRFETKHVRNSRFSKVIARKISSDEYEPQNRSKIGRTSKTSTRAHNYIDKSLFKKSEIYVTVNLEGLEKTNALLSICKKLSIGVDKLNNDIFDAFLEKKIEKEHFDEVNETLESILDEIDANENFNEDFVGISDFRESSQKRFNKLIKTKSSPKRKMRKIFPRIRRKNMISENEENINDLETNIDEKEIENEKNINDLETNIYEKESETEENINDLETNINEKESETEENINDLETNFDGNENENENDNNFDYLIKEDEILTQDYSNLQMMHTPTLKENDQEAIGQTDNTNMDDTEMPVREFEEILSPSDYEDAEESFT